MKRVLWFLALLACGEQRHLRGDDIVDGPGNVRECTCNPLQQTGCRVGEKCSWGYSASEYQGGHVTCGPSGSAAVGEPCDFGLARDDSDGCGTAIVDNCVRGAVCSGGVCKPVCDNEGGDPMCGSDQACVVDPTLFSTGSSTPAAAGVCVPACDPLADNDFLGSGMRGSACMAGSGCYGELRLREQSLAQFACMRDGSATLVNRSPVVAPKVNSCAEGYVPLVHETTGSTTVVCVALCAPGDTYQGNVGAQAPLGVAPHRCANTDARGVFGAHEHCMYVWRLEQVGSAEVLPPQLVDRLGVCIDHAQYRYDSNGDGAINGSDATWPDCQDLPVGSAAQFGCVSTTTAGALPTEPPPGL